ncbi:hypothetical protein NL676_023541 [Syzygium grande]|nr:hypothetical protein NL676_023541 [Syzygium grande]
MIVLVDLAKEDLSLGHPHNQASPNRVIDPRTSASCAVGQPEGEQRVKLCELSEQNSELSMKLRAERKRGVEFLRELEKCPIRGWWEAPVDQLCLGELKLRKRRYEEVSKILIQALGDRTADSDGNISNNPKGNDSYEISMSLK